jgi:hypothetical protein
MSSRRPPQPSNRHKNKEIGALINEYSFLKGWAREKEASHIIRKLGSCVKPIMRKRGWKVGVLAEFYPDERNLLGIVLSLVVDVLLIAHRLKCQSWSIHLCSSTPT